MKLLEKLAETWAGKSHPFLLYKNREVRFGDIAALEPGDLSSVKAGDVVAVIGDFEPQSILTLLRLIDLGAIVVPLTKETREDHEYFFQSASVDAVIEDSTVTTRAHETDNDLLKALREKGHAGLVLFTTGTTGRPKAILHDLTLFLERFETKRPTLRTMNFLLFDHIGGINTLLHTLFNRGVVVAPEARTVNAVLETIARYDVELLPTTPTFLRLMLISGAVPEKVPSCLKVITYGTERMDQPTLNELCDLLPNVDFRQTFGMSELGILRVKSEARDSLFMKVGGEGVETRVIDGVLQIRSRTRMLGYMNALSPFDEEGWYDTKDVVEEKNGYYMVVGRTTDVINVGGLKFMASEVERVALEFPGISLVNAYAKQNPITGQHVELKVQPTNEGTIDKTDLMGYLKSKLPAHMAPKRIRIESVGIGHRFKKLEAIGRPK